ncbi:MAG: cytidine deaminase [Deltaproteobacteria bacterium]|nr:cytidine deaminase [Deltaproteobacteria bacterium]
MKELEKLAVEARKMAYAPYSKYKVGAALLADDGNIYTGCNVENSSYGITICAERTAVAKAVSDGHRKFKAIAVATASSPPGPPCGICRQTLAEFSPDLDVILVNTRGEKRRTKLSKLYPDHFDARHLESAKRGRRK